MKSWKSGRVALWMTAVLAVVGVAGLTLLPTSTASAAQGAKAPKFVGAQKCKNCHSSAETGNQFEAWTKMKHAHAFEVLGSDEAKKVAAEKGIADPQKDDKCLKCHVTGFGAPAEQINKGFDIKMGVQCESCHGPGEAHMKARMAAAATATEGDKKPVVIGEGEIQKPTAATCTGCHNSESPSYKPFCFFKARAETAHLIPNRERTEEQKKALSMTCGCGDKCPTPDCATGKCGVNK